MTNKILPGIIAAFAVAIVAVGVASAAPPQRTSIVDVAIQENANSGEFSNLMAALIRVDDELGVGLLTSLDGNRQFTVFAPTDQAFDDAGQALGFTDGADLVANVDVNLLYAVLTYHVSPGNREASDVLSSDRVRTISKGFIFPYTDGSGSPYLMDSDSVLGAGSPDANIIAADISADNGTIHIIDWLLLP